MAIRTFLIPFLLVFVLVQCKPKQHDNEEITIFCASSLSPVLQQITKDWTENHNVSITINAASSGTLARQIEHGAPADIYLAANPMWMEYLMEAKELKKHAKSIAVNRLAIIVLQNSAYKTTDIKNALELLKNLDGKIAIADPGHVPLGKYSKQYLDYTKTFESLKSRLIYAKDARSTLRLVELGEAEIGIVYLSDAMTSDRVKIIAKIPEAFHEKIEYQGLLLNDAPHCKAFFDLLNAPKNLNIWETNGFTIE